MLRQHFIFSRKKSKDGIVPFICEHWSSSLAKHLLCTHAHLLRRREFVGVLMNQKYSFVSVPFRIVA